MKRRSDWRREPFKPNDVAQFKVALPKMGLMGEQNRRSKLTNAQRIEIIRGCYDRYDKQSIIYYARKFKVTGETIINTID